MCLVFLVQCENIQRSGFEPVVQHIRHIMRLPNMESQQFTHYDENQGVSRRNWVYT